MSKISVRTRKTDSQKLTRRVWAFRTFARFQLTYCHIYTHSLLHQRPGTQFKNRLLLTIARALNIHTHIHREMRYICVSFSLLWVCLERSSYLPPESMSSTTRRRSSILAPSHHPLLFANYPWTHILSQIHGFSKNTLKYICIHTHLHTYEHKR